jgi:hypothetical protein
MLRRFVTVGLVIFTFGWVLPLMFAIQWTIHWCKYEASPIIFRYEEIVHSFPFIYEAEKFWTFSAIWLFSVVMFWGTVGVFYMFWPQIKWVKQLVFVPR